MRDPSKGGGRVRAMVFACLAGAVALGAALPAGARQLTAPEDAQVPGEPISPAGAFVRSLVLPGWGHVSTGSFSRGGFYVAAQTGSAWMLWKSMSRKAEAEAVRRVERAAVAARLAATHPGDESLRTAIDEDPAVQRWEELVETRGQQVEDWTALSFFLILLGAADAFVAAHLMDYPEPLAFDVLPGGLGRGIEVRLTVPVGR